MKWKMTPNSRPTTPRASITPLERRKLLAAELRKLRSSAKLDAAENLKALADAEKSTASTWKERLETLRTAAVAISLMYGILALFCYCFFVAKFIPSGVTAGDTLLFSFLALALGVIGFMLASAGVMIWLPLTLPIDNRKDATQARKSAMWWIVAYAAACIFRVIVLLWASWQPVAQSWTWLPSWLGFVTGFPAHLRGHPWWLFFVSWMTIAFTASGTLKKRGASFWIWLLIGVGGSLLVLLVLELVIFPRGIAIVCGAVLGGEFLAFALDPTIGQGAQRKTRPFGVTLALAALGLLLPVFIISILYSEGTNPSIASITFGNFGLYAEDAAMELSAANLQTLTAASDLQGDTLDICHGPDGSAVVTGLKVWWHGIGTRSHVELPRANAPGVVVDLDTAQAHLIRNHRARCMDLPGAYFDSGSGQLTDDGRKELLDAVSRWTQREMNNARLEQIRVVGHTDPMTPVSGTTIRALSNDRAKAVVKALRESDLLKEFFTQDASTLSRALRIEGDAARQPLKECSTSSSLAERRECNAVNRRVELRLFFGPKNAAAQETAKSNS